MAHGIAVEVGAVEQGGCGVHEECSVACNDGFKIVFRGQGCEGNPAGAPLDFRHLRTTRIALGEPKNYRAIMLSSTFTDLKKHREQVIKAIREFGYKPEVMEDNGARADTDV